MHLLFSQRSHRPWASAAIACAAVTATLAAGPAASGAAAEPAPGASAGQGARGADERLVTLVTGDRVVLNDAGEAAGLVRAPGRERIPVQIVRTADSTLVLPADVRPLLADDVLDRRLFDVTALSGAADGLRLLVDREGEARDAAGAEALTVAPERAAAVWRSLTDPTGRDGTLAAAPGIASIALDAPAEDTAAGRTDGEEPLVELTVRATDREGNPAVPSSTLVADLDRGEFHELEPSDDGTTLTGRVPAGRYSVEATLLEWADDGTTLLGSDWLVRPDVTVADDTTVRLDAADARPVNLTGPDEDATQESVILTNEYVAEDGAFGMAATWLYPGAPEGHRTAQLGELADGWRMFATVSTWWENGDRRYHLVDRDEDGFYTGLDRHVPLRGLARIITRQGAWAEGRRGELFTRSSLVDFATAQARELPRVTEVFVQAGAGRWSQELWQLDAGGDQESFHRSEPREYRAGHRYQESFNTAVFGPAPHTRDGGILRTGDVIHGGTSPFGDGAGHAGGSLAEGARVTLYRNGEEYAVWDESADWFEFAVPGDEAAYELVVTAVRPGATAGTEVTASHAFESGPVGADETVRLPAAAVRFAPALTPENTSPAGRTVQVPVAVLGAAAPASLTVEVSHDGGATWTGARVRDGRIRVTNPPAGGTVSFRAEVTDADGNTTVQTLIDAYRTA
ncbi:hypothetical protein E1265_05475 [Streptomyces sp. 8K308]|uniref:hypothetical protein n=1 Tax=Streptomyces sp. 8K308 TaxID=2530388 RepID=UPI0010505E1D|nr:hypothetical protein [Streptomyces sp. 8K308]TDC25950.1 hypothetical protein E1265_05475 [Streptomyces sp. 8K308]